MNRLKKLMDKLKGAETIYLDPGTWALPPSDDAAEEARVLRVFQDDPTEKEEVEISGPVVYRRKGGPWAHVVWDDDSDTFRVVDAGGELARDPLLANPNFGREEEAIVFADGFNAGWRAAYRRFAVPPASVMTDGSRREVVLEFDGKDVNLVSKSPDVSVITYLPNGDTLTQN